MRRLQEFKQAMFPESSNARGRSFASANTTASSKNVANNNVMNPRNSPPMAARNSTNPRNSVSVASNSNAVAHLGSHQQPPAPPSNLGRSTTLAQPAPQATQPYRLGEFQCVQKYKAAMAAAAHHAAAAQRLIAAQNQQQLQVPAGAGVRAQSLGPVPVSRSVGVAGGLLPPYIPSPVQLASPVLQPQSSASLGSVKVGSASVGV